MLNNDEVLYKNKSNGKITFHHTFLHSQSLTIWKSPNSLQLMTIAKDTATRNNSE